LNVVSIRAINVDSPVPLEELERYSLRVLESLGKDRWDVSILLCDDQYIHELNGRYRDRDEPTDVLSFAQDSNYETEGYYVAGDIVISVDTMKKNADDHHISEKDETRRLLVHGLLHLAGMDHDEESSEGEMLDLQERILRENSGD